MATQSVDVRMMCRRRNLVKLVALGKVTEHPRSGRVVGQLVGTGSRHAGCIDTATRSGG